MKNLELFLHLNLDSSFVLSLYCIHQNMIYILGRYFCSKAMLFSQTMKAFIMHCFVCSWRGGVDKNVRCQISTVLHVEPRKWAKVLWIPAEGLLGMEGNMPLVAKSHVLPTLTNWPLQTSQHYFCLFLFCFLKKNKYREVPKTPLFGYICVFRYCTSTLP